jgi:hypothetical protein
LAVEYKSVPRIGASLKTGDDIIAGGEVIHNFTFPFISPLKAQEYIYCHLIKCLFGAGAARAGAIALPVKVERVMSYFKVK